MFSINGIRPRLCYDPITATLMVASLAMSGMAAASAYKNSKNQAKAVAEQGAMKARERAKQTQMLASKQKTSFLSSGISLTGEGTAEAMVQDTYDTGLADINQIKSNYNQQSSNIMSAARSKLLSDVGKMGMSVAMAGVGGAFSSGGSFAAGGEMASGATLGGGTLGGSAGLGSGNFVGGTGFQTAGSLGFV